MRQAVSRLQFRTVLPPIIWMIAIFAMSNRSSVPHTPGLSAELAAAAGHMMVFGILAVLISRALRPLFRGCLPLALCAWLATVLYGISDEFHQSFVPGRFASLEDVVLDAVGAAIALAIYFVFLRRQQEVRAPA